MGEPDNTNEQAGDQPREDGYEQLFRPEATLDDLDLELVESFLEPTPAGGRPATEALEHYDLIERDGDGWRVTNAALLLFARAPADRWHARAGVGVFRVTGIRPLHGREQNVTRVGRADPPLARAIEESRRVASAQIHRSETLRDIFFEDLAEYPDFAWREALVNAIAHRDYGMQNRETEVWFFDDRVEIRSPGTLVEPVTLEDLREGKQGRAVRNPMLVRVLVDAGVMRGEGTGVSRIFGEMAGSSLREPKVNEGSKLFSFTLLKEPVFETAGPGWSYVVRRLRISADQKRILLARPDGFSHVDYQKLNSVQENEAKWRVQELVERGIAFRDFGTGDEVTVCYLSAELDDTRWFLEDRVPRLREHFRKDPWLRSGNYRELFKTNVRDTGQELRHLVELGFLRVEGQRRGARYMPAAGLRT